MALHPWRLCRLGRIQVGDYVPHFDEGVVVVRGCPSEGDNVGTFAVGYFNLRATPVSGEFGPENNWHTWFVPFLTDEW